MLVSFALRDSNFSRHLTQTLNASQWNIGCVGSYGVGHEYFMYISCIGLIHVVCASFSAFFSLFLNFDKLANARILFYITLCVG